MKILIVDDDIKRSRSLADHLVEKCVCNAQDIETADCVDRARGLLKGMYFDALVLDVVLPKHSGEKADSQNSISLLSQLNKSSRLNKPEKIIGLTSHIDDIASYKRQFEKYCLTVIEAKINSGQWRSNIVGALSYTASSKFSRVVSEKDIHVITVHGIRTFGEWQVRFRALVEKRTAGIAFSSYNYGYFSPLAFLIPYFRRREVARLKHHLQTLFDDSDASFIIFSHSFGTYLAAHALRELNTDSHKMPLSLLVLSGSVLPERFDWGFLLRKGGIRIVNDCADRDYVLWISKATSLGTGMAGKCGFYGIQSSDLVNRYFRGGHSSYFDGNDFMEKYWVPLLLTDDPVHCVDERSPSALAHGVFEKIIVGIGFMKPAAYGLLVLGGLFSLARLVSG